MLTNNMEDNKMLKINETNIKNHLDKKRNPQTTWALPNDTKIDWVTWLNNQNDDFVKSQGFKK